MRKTALKALLIALMLSLTVSLAACGGDNPSSGGNGTGSATISAGDPAYAQTYPEVKVEYPTGTEIYSVEESFVKTQVRNAVMSYLNVDGDERASLLTAVADLKSNTGVDLLKAIGTLTDINIQTPGDGGTYNVSITALGTAEEFKALTDYYKSLSGVDNTLFESSTSLVIQYNWGKLNTCRFVDSMGLIQASFSFSLA